MATNGKFLGKDGQWYDTAQEMWSANSAWNEKQGIQKEQNRLIQQQNQLLQQQNELNYQIEQEKIQKNYELEMNKMKHEEKMRILKLFDNVGINKETYDLYINTNFNNETNKELLEQKDEHLLMSSKYDFLLHEAENEEKYGFDNYDATMEKYGLYDLKVDLMDEDCYEKVSKSKQKEKENLTTTVKKTNKCLKYSLISVPFAIILLIAGFETPIAYAAIVFISLLFTSIICSICIGYSARKELKEIPDKTFSINKYNKKLNSLISKEQEAVNKIINTLKSNNESLVSKFYDFRIKHYNANIEKLLIDAGYKELVESLGIKYQTVNNSNKKHNGTVEDYIEYLETNS